MVRSLPCTSNDHYQGTMVKISKVLCWFGQFFTTLKVGHDQYLERR